LEAITGLSRPTVAERLAVLESAGLIRYSSKRVASGGRPARVIRLNEKARLIVAFDLAEEGCRVGLTDLRANLIEQVLVDTAVTNGPKAVLKQMIAAAQDLVAKCAPDCPIGGIGVSLPASVEYGQGRSVGWSVMVGWDGYPVRDHLQQAFGVPVFIDNDVNLLVLAERHLYASEFEHLLFVKVGTGIGSGLIVDGRINRGAVGSAGDIGHTRVSGYGDPVCRCGNVGCLEAVAGGWALARDLEQPELSPAEVMRFMRRGDANVLALMRNAGRALGEAVAFAVSMLNPEAIVIGGEIGQNNDLLMAGVRELVYQRSLPLATKNLVLRHSQLSQDGLLAGAAFLAVDELLDPDRVDAWLGQ
jgi:predicted NBD/HSP70 family sugar kinase